jgi:hypothetical protein
LFRPYVARLVGAIEIADALIRELLRRHPDLLRGAWGKERVVDDFLEGSEWSMFLAALGHTDLDRLEKHFRGEQIAVPEVLADASKETLASWFEAASLFRRGH